MDPDQALADLRAAVVNGRRVAEARRFPLDDSWTQLLDAADVLDQWLTKGGFLPAGWAAASHIVVDTTPIRASTMCPGCGQMRPVRWPGGFVPHHTAHNGVDGPVCTEGRS